MINKSVLKDKEINKKCKCIFCQSKCPHCGSNNINVRFKPEFEYSLEEGENIINISYDDAHIWLHCQECGHHERTCESQLIGFISCCLELPSGVDVIRKKETIEILPYILKRKR